MPSFSRGLEKALHQAMQQAREYSHEFATLEHLLLALTYDQATLDVLDGCDVDVEALRSDLDDFVKEELDSLVLTNGQDARPTAAFQRVIQRAVIHIQSSGKEEVTTANVLAAVFAERESHAAYFLEQQDMTRLDAVNFINHGIRKSGPDVRRPPEFRTLLPGNYERKLAQHLNEAAALATDHQHLAVTVAHVLNAVLKSGDGAALFKQLGIATPHLRKKIASSLKAEATGKVLDNLKVAPRLKATLQAAYVTAATADRDQMSLADFLDAALAVERLARTEPSEKPKSAPSPAGGADPSPPSRRSKSAIARPRGGDGFAFLSYSRSDSAMALKMVSLLRDRGLEVRWDQDLAVGEGWRDKLAEAVERSSAVVTLWTENSIKSQAVREEAELGRRAGKLVHACFNGCRPPFGFAETQYAVVEGWDGTSHHPAIEKVVQAIADKVNPPSPKEVAARLGAYTASAATISRGMVSVVDAPPGGEPPIRDAEDRKMRVAAQRHLADRIVEELAGDQQNYLPESLTRCVRRYAEAVREKVLTWYILDDAMSSIIDAKNQHTDVPWPGTTKNDVDRLHTRHCELEPLIRPAQPHTAPPTAEPAPPLLNPAKLEDENVRHAIDRVRETVAAGQAAEVLDGSVGTAVEHFSNRVNDAMLEGGTLEAKVRRREGLIAGLVGLGSVLSKVVDATTAGLKRGSLLGGAATEVAKSLRLALEAIIDLFR